MFYTMRARWLRLPLWGKWVSGLAVVFLWSSIGPALNERHFLPALFQNFVALSLHWGLIALAFGGAIWAGLKVAAKTGKSWLGWVVGLVVVVVIAGPVTGLFEGLPGVGKRLSDLGNSDCYTEWDGRSNPVVCD
ncbi:hypothetical protein [Aliirhizobium smilacinae]|uniref:Uncharacterized protein n=1 Tax=Aliirhizobium smilacinae TaxID=1395944 RepID=A0A5C4XRB1_9HYPH|nr:hypothetical protein [Rhizobium smilacinae]TNM65070.1 hypothetical protein FHP24_01885 [Rhizobium smilacinae]